MLSRHWAFKIDPSFSSYSQSSRFVYLVMSSSTRF